MPSVEPDTVRRLYAEGWTQTSIAGALRVSRRTIARHLSRAGTPSRGSRRAGNPLTWSSIWDRLELDGECWLFTGPAASNGYARITVDGRQLLLHRFVYELLVSPIPDGLTIDHLCCQRLCVNPAHLDPVPASVNTARAFATGLHAPARTGGLPA